MDYASRLDGRGIDDNIWIRVERLFVLLTSCCAWKDSAIRLLCMFCVVDDSQTPVLVASLFHSLELLIGLG